MPLLRVRTYADHSGNALAADTLLELGLELRQLRVGVVGELAVAVFVHLHVVQGLALAESADLVEHLAVVRTWVDGVGAGGIRSDDGGTLADGGAVVVRVDREGVPVVAAGQPCPGCRAGELQERDAGVVDRDGGRDAEQVAGGRVVDDGGERELEGGGARLAGLDGDGERVPGDEAGRQALGGRDCVHPEVLGLGGESGQAGSER